MRRFVKFIRIMVTFIPSAWLLSRNRFTRVNSLGSNDPALIAKYDERHDKLMKMICLEDKKVKPDIIIRNIKRL
jgi:hypothetical protein